jgi:hypothetical protein
MTADLHPNNAARPVGRGLFWLGVGLCALGIALVVLQYSLGRLITPWYLPILATLGAVLLAWSVARRRSALRILGLVMAILVAGFGWLFLFAAALPDYEGPAHAGQPIPGFQTRLADGRPFSDENLRDGRPSVLVFFRGRW